MWTKQQVTMYVAQHQLQLVKEERGVKWYRQSDGSFLAVRNLPNGYADVKALPAASCGCG